MIKSISTFAWMKSPSVDRLTVPLIPIRQCSLVLWSTALLSRFLLCPGLLMLVRIQHMSSHRLKPHFRRQKRPISSPSLLPHHRNTKLRLAATSPISNSIIYEYRLFFNKGVTSREEVRCIISTHLIPIPKLHVCSTAGTLVLFQRGFDQNYIELAIQFLQIVRKQVGF